VKSFSEARERLILPHPTFEKAFSEAKSQSFVLFKKKRVGPNPPSPSARSNRRGLTGVYPRESGFLRVFFNDILRLPLHLKLPRVNPFLFTTAFVQIPIERASFTGSAFFIHLHSLEDKISSAFDFKIRLDFGIGIL
jgi:hypothetical protein